MAVLFSALFLPACSNQTSDSIHGYIEGEFVYVASPNPGIVNLAVSRGDIVKKGDLLFALESDAELNYRNESKRRVLQAKATLKDAGKGARPTELASITAQIQQAKSALDLAEKEFARKTRLLQTGAVSTQELDISKSSRDQQLYLVEKLEADIKTSQLGARRDQIEALKENVKALESVLERAEWDLSQKSRRSPEDAAVYDTLYRSGEWVSAGKPVVSILPPSGIKARVFVPENKLAEIHINTPVTVNIDGISSAFNGKVTYISPRPEYTPPVIYSRESRAKFVYMVEAAFEKEAAVKLHPGQPVDLIFRH